MRITIIAPPWLPVPPPAYGGTEAVLDTLARGLRAIGHDVLLYTTGDSTCEVERGWLHATAPGTAAIGQAAEEIERHHVEHAYKAAIEWNADVVHDHTLLGPAYGQRLAVPVVTTNHGPFEGELGPLYRSIADRVPIIALSQHHAMSARDTQIAAVIHHGVDVDSFPFGAGDGGYALFLGRMTPDKGVHTAARIARDANLPLRIAAKMREPAEFAYFKDAVAPMLGGSVEYIGEIGGRAKQLLLAGAACLLNPLAWPEPFGMVIIEALACGTPVVATPCGSVPELVTDGVTGFVRCEAEELGRAMQGIRQIDRAACRKAVEDRFSTARMVADHVQLYERVRGTRTEGIRAA